MMRETPAVLYTAASAAPSPPAQLGLRPLRKVLRITKFSAGSPAVEAPVDLGPGAIHPPGPGAGFAPQGGEVRESSAAEALACEEPDFDFRLVEPTAVDRGVVRGEALPQLAASLFPIAVGQGFGAVDVEIVHHQVNGPGARVLSGQFKAHPRELEPRPVWRREGEVPAGFGLDRTEDIGGAAAPVFVVAPGLAPWGRSAGGAHVG